MGKLGSAGFTPLGLRRQEFFLLPTGQTGHGNPTEAVIAPRISVITGKSGLLHPTWSHQPLEASSPGNVAIATEQQND